MSPNKPDTSVQSRLTKALKYLQLVRTSRELSYDSVPFVMAAEHLISEAAKMNSPKLYNDWGPTNVAK